MPQGVVSVGEQLSACDEWGHIYPALVGRRCGREEDLELISSGAVEPCQVLETICFFRVFGQPTGPQVVD